MKVLIDTYDTAFQNKAGGVHNRIEKTVEALRGTGIVVDYFDKYSTDITEYDILHVFKLDASSKVLIDYAYNNGLKIVISSIMTIEKGGLVDFYWMVRKLPIATLYKQVFEICKKLHALIVETPKEAFFMKRHYHVHDKIITVIPNGAGVDISTNNLIFDKIGEQQVYALVVARFDKNKNQINVIKALRNTSMTVVFIGGPDSSGQEYYNLCIKEAGEASNIYFLGWLDNKDPLLKSAIGNAKVIVCPSYHETFGLSIIEGAMAGAIPVISNTLPICDFEVFKNCLMFNPNNICEIRDKIYKGLHSDHDDNFSENVQKYFSWTSVAKKHIEIYERILKL